MKVQTRQLSTLEKAFHSLNQAQPFTCIVAANIKGSLPLDILEKALDIMRKRHYYLHYSIHEKDNKLEWHYEDDSVFPIDVIESARNDQWIDICNFEINVSVILSKAPLAKIIYVKNSDGIDLILKISHIISDGVSAYNFMRELFMVIDKLYSQKSPDFEYPLDDIYTDVKYFPQSFAKTEEIPNHKNLPVDLLENYPYFPLQDRLTHIFPVQLSQENSLQVLKKCKEKKVTVNSLLAASLIVTIKEHIQGAFKTTEDFTIKSSAGVNLRSYYPMEIKGEQFGCWSGFGVVFFNSNEFDSVWDCAELFQNRLKEIIDQRKPFAHWENLIKNPNNHAKKQNKEFPIPYVLLTNVGNFALNELYCNNTMQIKNISLQTPMHRHWVNDLGFGIVAYSFNSRLNLCFHYMSPARTLEQAKDFSEKIIALLL